MNVLDVLAKMFGILSRKCLVCHAEDSGASCERFLFQANVFKTFMRYVLELIAKVF